MRGDLILGRQLDAPAVLPMEQRHAERVQELTRVCAIPSPHRRLEEGVPIGGAIQCLEKRHHLLPVARVEEREDSIAAQQPARLHEVHVPLHGRRVFVAVQVVQGAERVFIGGQLGVHQRLVQVPQQPQHVRLPPQEQPVSYKMSFMNIHSEV